MIFDNIKRIQERIKQAQDRSGRRGKVEILAVTKYAPLEAVRELLATGLVNKLGESRVQDAKIRISELGRPLSGGGPIQWHMIGRLQTNKAKLAAELFDLIQSLDSLRLAEALERALSAESRSLSVLVQVKLTAKETQGGLSPEELPAFLDKLKSYPSLKLRGLMAIAPMLEPVEAVRPFFKSLRALFEARFDERNDFLSMGMSRDFEIAVEEGANLLRIGSELFKT